MKQEIFSKNLKNIEYQRNLFILISIIVLVSNLLLSIKNLYEDEKIILVPGLKSLAWVKDNSVSESYIEEMSLMFLNLLLDISPHNIEFKKSLILTHMASQNEESTLQIKKYFLDVESKYKKFAITSYFTPQNIDIDAEELTATTTGILNSNFGKKGEEVTTEKYRLTFALQRGSLKLKSFENIRDDKK